MTRTNLSKETLSWVTGKRVVKGGGGGWSKSRSTENKTVLSQFMKNKDIMKITVHDELNIYFSSHGK